MRQRLRQSVTSAAYRRRSSVYLTTGPRLCVSPWRHLCTVDDRSSLCQSLVVSASTCGLQSANCIFPTAAFVYITLYCHPHVDCRVTLKFLTIKLLIQSYFKKANYFYYHFPLVFSTSDGNSNSWRGSLKPKTGPPPLEIAPPPNCTWNSPVAGSYAGRPSTLS